MAKVVIVTGASRGIGRAISTRLSKENMNVILASRRAEKLSQIKSQIEKLGTGEVIDIPTDVTNEEEVKNLVEATIHHFGRIDAVINNAGVGLFKRADEFTVGDYNYIFDVNVKGVFLVCKHIVSQMIKQQSGHIINIASIAGKTGFKNGTLYSASKHAVVGYSWSLREDVKEHKIKVTVVCPGSVVTNFGGKKPERVEWSMEPEDVAHAISYLLYESDTVNTAEMIIKPRYNPRTIDWDKREE